jgi:protein-tyrosine-phosphatase
MFAELAPGYRATSAGTLVLEGHPMSSRTRSALRDHGLTDFDHRSRQFGDEHAAADLVVAMEPDHVTWVRRHHPEAADRTATLPRLVRDLPALGSMADRVAGLGLATVEVEPWEEVVDPAAGDQAVFDACAVELYGLVEALAARLSDPSTTR